MRLLSRVAKYLLSLFAIIIAISIINFASLQILTAIHSPLGDILIFFAWFIICYLVTAYQLLGMSSIHSLSNVTFVLRKFNWLTFGFCMLLDVFFSLGERYFPSRHLLSSTDYLTSVLPVIIISVFPRMPFPFYSASVKIDLTPLLQVAKDDELASLLSSIPATLFKHRLPNGETPLTYLLTYRPVPAMVSVLLERGADANLPNVGGYYPLHLAVKLGYLDIVELLLQHGASTETLAPQQTSLLQIAAGSGQEALVERLLEQGMAVNAVNELGDTPLHFAARNGRVAVVETLLRHGADPRLQNRAGATPLEQTEKPAVGAIEQMNVAGRVKVILILRQAWSSG